MDLSISNRSQIIKWIDHRAIIFIDKLVLLFTVIAFYMSVWPHWFANGGIPTIYPIYFVFLYGISRIILKPDVFKIIARLGYTWWLIFYFIILTITYIITLIGYSHLYGNDIQDVYNVQITFLGASVAFLVLLSNKENYIFVRKLIVIGVIAGVVVNFLDVLDFSEKWGGIDLRAAGYYMNPNSSAIILSMGFVFTFYFVHRNFRIIYFLIYLFGVFITLSRGAIPIIFVISLSLLWSKSINFKSIILVSITILIVIFFAITMASKNQKYDLILQKIAYNEGYQNRLLTIINPFHTKFEMGVRDEVALDHIKFYLKSPIVGNGLASSVYAQKNITATNHGSHIQYIHMLNEFGILGLIMLFSLPFSICIYRKNFYLDRVIILFTIVYLIGCLSSHNMYDNKSLLFSYALFGVMLSHKH